MILRSLRTRLLVPLAACSLAVAAVIGIVSYRLGDAAVRSEMEARFVVVQRTLREARFPLTSQVLQTLADLSQVELATYDAAGNRLQTTLDNAPRQLLPSDATSPDDHTWSDQRMPRYRTRVFRRREGDSGGSEVGRVLVMFADADTRRQRFAAAALPLITGLSSTALLSLVAWVLAERMIARIGRLEQTVNRVAAGDFLSPSATSDVDELGRLENAVRCMGNELRALWDAVHRQERQRLIHQMAAGLAHQLRNALTGARMAIELHEQRNPTADGKGLRIAMGEIQRTEDYVQRILSIAADAQRQPAAGAVGPALDAVRESLSVIAKHHGVELSWNLDPALSAARVADVSSLRGAIENLVINAIQAGGNRVQVEGRIEAGHSEFRVIDNGPGPALQHALPERSEEDALTRTGESSPEARDSSPEVLGDLFDPFVTTKPEGLGLGLTVVRRAAENLGGRTSWERDGKNTVFRFSASLLASTDL